MFTALRRCVFDRCYEKGEMIPDKVIDKSMVKKLIKCGVISEHISEDNKTVKKKTKSQEQDVVI